MTLTAITPTDLEGRVIITQKKNGPVTRYIETATYVYDESYDRAKLNQPSGVKVTALSRRGNWKTDTIPAHTEVQSATEEETAVFVTDLEEAASERFTHGGISVAIVTGILTVAGIVGAFLVPHEQGWEVVLTFPVVSGIFAAIFTTAAAFSYSEYKEWRREIRKVAAEINAR